MLFVLHATDKLDSREIRKANRDAHLAYLAQFETPVAGPLLDAQGNMAGSCIFLEVEDRTAAETFAANDPYAKAGLFAEVSIREFKKVIWP